MKRSHGPQFLARKESSVSLTPIAEERVKQVCESLHCSRSRAVDALIRSGSFEGAKEVIDGDLFVVKTWRMWK